MLQPQDLPLLTSPVCNVQAGFQRSQNPKIKSKPQKSPKPFSFAVLAIHPLTRSLQSTWNWGFQEDTDRWTLQLKD